MRKALLQIGIACREEKRIAVVDNVLELVGVGRIGESAIEKAQIGGFIPLIAEHSDRQ